MKPQYIVATCLRFLAAIWVLYLLSRVHTVFTYLADQRASLHLKSIVVTVALLQLVICVYLWFFPLTVATRLMPFASSMENSTASPTILEWQTLGVICIGLWGMSRAIPSAVYWITLVNLMFSDGLSFASLSPDVKASVFSTTAELAISAWLLFGARGFAAILFKIRTAGVSK